MFFKKLKIRLKDSFKNYSQHKFKLLGLALIWLAPLIFLTTFISVQQAEQAQSGQVKITYEPWVVLVLAIILLIYFKAFRRALREKVLTAKIKNLPINPFIYLGQAIGVLGALGVVFWLIDILNKVNLTNLLTYLKLIMVSVGLGYLCLAIDSINDTKIEDKELKETKE